MRLIHRLLIVAGIVFLLGSAIILLNFTQTAPKSRRL